MDLPAGGEPTGRRATTSPPFRAEPGRVPWARPGHQAPRLRALTPGLAPGWGPGIFKQKTDDVTFKYTTPITPAHWALFVWDFTYFWFLAMFVYLVVGLFRRSAYDWLYTTPAVLPYGFHVSFIINMSLNITWLFLFDRELLLPGLITSAMMALTDYMILFFSCQGLKIYGAWLNKYWKADLWFIRILVQNGVAVYTTWGTLFTLLNLTIYLQHQTSTSRCDCAMLSLLLLLLKLLAWFLLENFYLDEHVRYIMTIYPVVILWLTGTLSNSSSPGSQIYIFAAVILAISCIMFVARVALVTWRHHKRPLYTQNSNHVLVHAGSVALAVITQVISDFIFILAKESCVPNDFWPSAVFQTSSRNVSETFPLELTLDGWSQNFWIVIDFWSKAWLLYAVVGLCKRNVLGPESCNPEIHPPVFYQMWIMINIARMCSMSLWDRHYILGAVAVGWIVPVFSFYMLYISYSNLNKHKRWLTVNNPNVISWTRYLTQNGLAVFAWWSLLHAMVGLGVVFKYKAGVADPVISTVILTIVALFVII
ncbi:hypothetical protein L3Q82_018164 [Scortum barcoo]|uniref:Uncharacterized protein n=1 Tax=Scortum barcoo TaxID=214431 RepID=A0ACB8VIC9_9TELE|nr:hypothetical protein L3Q82_018164 [Scortum barcoo]